MQLEIDGIGQQKYTLAMWKVDHKIFTFHAPHMQGRCPTWSCWDEIKCPIEFIGKYGDHNQGFGNTEKEAILDFCEKQNIKPPFWW